MTRRIPTLLLVVAACAATPETETPAARWPAAAEVPAAEAPDVSGRPGLNALLRLALERNPRIRAARARALAAGELPALEGALPDPKLMLGWYETNVETRVGPMEATLGIQQEVPWPGKLTDRADLGRALARKERVAYERAVRDVLTEVVRAAHELDYVHAAVDVSAGIAALLERYVAQGATASPLDELFRAETQRAQLDYDRVLLAEMRVAEEERLRALLDLPPSAPVGRPRVGPPPPLASGFDELMELALAHNHELREAGLALEAAALRTSLAVRERLPNFTVGYTRVLVGDAVFSTPPDSGRDADLVTLGLTLPIWPGKNAARVRHARALERAAALDREDVRAQLRARLADTLFRVRNAERLVQLYEGTLVPRAELAARTAEDLEKGTLAGRLETIAVLHQFRLAGARARADHGRAVALLESLLGRPLAVTEESR